MFNRSRMMAAAVAGLLAGVRFASIPSRIVESEPRPRLGSRVSKWRSRLPRRGRPEKHRARAYVSHAPGTAERYLCGRFIDLHANHRLAKKDETVMCNSCQGGRPKRRSR